MTTSDETPEPPAEESPTPSEPIAGADRRDEAATAVDPADTLSPAVRRLVRQYDLDITGIHGTGPDGRIRVGDVISVLGPRAEQAVREPVTQRPPQGGDEEDDARAAPAEPAAAVSRESQPAAAPVTTTVFDCDLGRVLADRKRLRAENVDVLLTTYFVVACLDALDAVPELTSGERARLGVHLMTADVRSRSLRLDSATLEGAPAERLRLADSALRASVGADLTATNLLVHHYGASGSLIATPTPIGADHVASVGIGRVRREVVVRTVDGDDAPRVGSRCYLTVSFFPERLALARANEFLARVVRVLEPWAD